MKEAWALAVTDLHDEQQALGFLEEFLENDRDRKAGARIELVLLCGDLTTRGPVAFAEEFFLKLEEWELPWLGIHGNMDPQEVRLEMEMRGGWIHGRKEEWNGFEFAGWGGSSPTPNDTPCEYSEEEIAGGLAGIGITEKTVLVTHAPPYNTFADLVANDTHIGSISLRRAIEEKKPRAVFCGHAHEAEGTEMLGATKIVKVGPLMMGRAALVELNSLKTEFLKTERTW